MLKKLNELRSKHAEKVKAMRDLYAKAEQEKRSMSDEEATQFDELRSEADNLKTEIGRVGALVEEQRGQVLDGEEHHDQGGVPTNEELRHYILTGETRSMSTDSDKDGGYTVIPELDRQVMRRLTDESEMRLICTVKRTGAQKYEKLVSVGGATVNHGSEGTTRTETNTAKMEKVTIPLAPIYAYPKTTQEILDFSDINILEWLSDEVSDTFVETEEDDLVNGDGTGKSKGFMSYDRAETDDKTRPFGTLQKMVAATTTAISSDELIDLLFKLKKKYRKNAVWTMNSNTAAALNKLKNSNGDYIWRDGMKAGEPDMLLGKPVHYLENLDDIGAGNAPIAVGNFKRGYYIVDHTTGTRTRPDSITSPGFYKVHTDKYLGGGVVDSNAIKVLEMKSA